MKSKFISAVMAVVMALSMSTVAFAADFKDTVNIPQSEAIDVIETLGVVSGYGDDVFEELFWTEHNQKLAERKKHALRVLTSLSNAIIATEVNLRLLLASMVFAAKGSSDTTLMLNSEHGVVPKTALVSTTFAVIFRETN